MRRYAVTPSELTAARLRVALDRDLNLETPAIIEEIARLGYHEPELEREAEPELERQLDPEPGRAREPQVDPEPERERTLKAEPEEVWKRRLEHEREMDDPEPEHGG